MARSLTKIYLQVLLILILCLAGAGYAGYRIVHDILLSSYQEEASQTARAAADQINSLMAEQHQALENIARQAGIVNALQRGSPAERARKEEEMKSALPGVIAIHLLARNGSGELISGKSLDPACVDFIRRAISTKGPMPPEFHGIGTDSLHYDMAAPVRDQDRKAVGYLLARYSATPLQNGIAPVVPAGGYLELQQPLAGEPAQTVLEIGEPPRADTATVTSALSDSRWTLIYQPAVMPPIVLSGDRVYLMAIIVFAFVTMLIVLFRLYRQTTKAVRHDIRSLIRMFRDLREGSVRVDYPMALREFSEIFDYLRDRGQKLVAERQKLKDMGLMDHLSQLGNRRHFEVRLKELFESSRANGPSSVLIIDMDHFKAVNDNHGHDAGDALIVGFANALRKVVRQTDVLVRLGGDEFCIIYAYAPLAKATVLVERLRKQLPREIQLTKGVIHRLRWTGGLSAMHDKDAKPDDVLWRADQALLQAKEGGRNITRIYDPAGSPPVKKKIITG